MLRCVLAVILLVAVGCAEATPPSNDALAAGEGEGEGGGDGSDRDPISNDPGLPGPGLPGPDHGSEGEGEVPGEGEGEGEGGGEGEGEGDDSAEGEGEGDGPAEGEGEGEGEGDGEGEGEGDGDGDGPPAPDPACRDFVRCQYECRPGDVLCNERCWDGAHPVCRDCQLDAWEGCWTTFCPAEAAALFACIGAEGCRERTWAPEVDNCVSRRCGPQLTTLVACAERQQVEVEARFDAVCQPGYDVCNGRPLCDGLIDCWWDCGPFEVECELACWDGMPAECRACELSAFEECVGRFCPDETARLFGCRDANGCDDYTWAQVDGSCTSEGCPTQSEAFYTCYDDRSEEILAAYLGGVCSPIYAACEAEPVD